jgi:serine protease AprX
MSIKTILSGTFIILYLFVGALHSIAQVAPDKYLVEFTDKNGTPYSVDQPEAFLSQRAIERRTRQQIPVTVTDLPVNPDYIGEVATFGVQVLQRTKWFNAIVIKTVDTNALNGIEQLPFVKKIVKSPVPLPEPGFDSTDFSMNKPGFREELSDFSPINTSREFTSLDYGDGFSQIGMVGGTLLHDQGFQGQGMGIAILDGGFSATNIMDVFDSLRAGLRIMGTRNFVGGGTYVYQGTPHGSSVLSTMAAYWPGFMIGTAPLADYWLVRTEDINGEDFIEEYNWICGAEYADSTGADIISSSLAYRQFQEPGTSHTYEQTNGDTAPISIGADIAASRGIIVVTSAGNSGEEELWPFIGFPADADSVFVVGSVDAHGIYAPFSSTGPTIDGRLKPDVVARGVATVVAVPDGTLDVANGTSFSTPIVAGMIACLWQAFPGKTNMEIMQIVRQSGSQATTPDNLLGYGIPDFGQAYQNTMGINDLTSELPSVNVYPNPFNDRIYLEPVEAGGEQFDVRLFDASGRMVMHLQKNLPQGGNIELSQGLEHLSPGLYHLVINDGNNSNHFKLIRR